ncbi:MAG: hypothetical protein DRI34_09095 [Deltaproteobacteria bacterium]|nr:MAG: hypothetical protein DRI34_09095 [Deltaproteobacteria bacterium]
MKRIPFVAFLLAAGMMVPAQAQSLFEQCQQKKRDIEQMEAQARQMGSDIAGLDSQIRDLQRRRADKMREKRRLERRIRLDKTMMERSCRGLRECEKLDRRVENLKRRLEPLARRLDAIRQELDKRRAESNDLDREIERITTSYRQLNCDGLVAGQTDQNTIDRCSQLFSRWNKLQKRINLLDIAIRQMHQRYTKVMRRMRSLRAEITRLLARMRTRCGHSSFITELERLDQQQRNWQAWGTQMQDLSNRLKRARKLKVLRPRLRPAPHKPKPKPKLRPAKRPRLKKVP